MSLPEAPPGQPEYAPPELTSALRYRAAWRWHFFAGVFVVPFLLLLATTGLIMLYYSTVETPVGEHLYVDIAEKTTSPAAQLVAAHTALPGSNVTQYIRAPAPDRPAQFELTRADTTYVVDVDPYTNTVLRVVDKDSTTYALARRIHSTLLMGDLGDLLLEIVAGLALLLVATGTYMWLQQRRTAPVPQASRRLRWRRWHLLAGLYGALGLCFFLLSGLAWTNLWGGKFVQAWGSFPAEKWGPVLLSDDTHSAMNHGTGKDVPWGLEQTPMPASTPGAPDAGDAATIGLDAVDRLAQDMGFGWRYRINLPEGAEGVYTISSDSMNGDTQRPGDERTVHIDRYNGKVLAQVGFDDYSLLAKSMAVGVAVHQGSMGWWSIALDVLVCVVVIFLCLSGTLLWWLRRPTRSQWLPVAPPVVGLPLLSSLTVLLVLIGFAFPLLGATLLVVLLVYLLTVRTRHQGR